MQTFISLSDSLNPNIIIVHSTNLTDIPIVGNTESLWQSNDPSKHACSAGTHACACACATCTQTQRVEWQSGLSLFNQLWSGSKSPNEIIMHS